MFKEQFGNQRGWMDGKFIDICCCHCCHQQIRMLFTRPRFPAPSPSSTHPFVTALIPIPNILHPTHSSTSAIQCIAEYLLQLNVSTHIHRQIAIYSGRWVSWTHRSTQHIYSANQCYRYSTNHCEKCDPSIIIIYRARKKDIHKCMGPCVWIVQIWWSHVLIYLCPCLPCPGLHLPRRIIPISMAISRLSKNETKTLYNG